jgi:hypothetical protein
VRTLSDFGPGTEVPEADRTASGRNAAFTRPLRMPYSAASTLPALRRSTRLAQYGGPRAGVRFGTSRRGLSGTSAVGFGATACFGARRGRSLTRFVIPEGGLGDASTPAYRTV